MIATTAIDLQVDNCYNKTLVHWQKEVDKLLQVDWISKPEPPNKDDRKAPDKGEGTAGQQTTKLGFENFGTTKRKGSLKQLKKSTAGCSVYTSGWSACRRFFIIATTATELQVDNCYNRTLVHWQKEFDKVLQVDWIWKLEPPDKDDGKAPDKAQNEPIHIATSGDVFSSQLMMLSGSTIEGDMKTSATVFDNEGKPLHTLGCEICEVTTLELSKAVGSLMAVAIPKYRVGLPLLSTLGWGESS
ncbi:hypothetical protein COLO4_29146 [Corchorus olitorius]|uniref:Uncharacterized protein n=1 Tax=Corchorus olitorius TaxID=93759 RepID=A0A1R3HG70_9ROSI|nr:hypothetical protein COLO4_29146 [Corchorus olitorius]